LAKGCPIILAGRRDYAQGNRRRAERAGHAAPWGTLVCAVRKHNVLEA
jgi:hypothetical protein